LSYSTDAETRHFYNFDINNCLVDHESRFDFDAGDGITGLFVGHFNNPGRIEQVIFDTFKMSGHAENRYIFNADFEIGESKQHEEVTFLMILCLVLIKEVISLL
jgi:hypothetical protein